MKLPRVLLVALIILCVIGGAGRSLNAQTEPLAQVGRTLDGTISVHLPADWLTQDTATSIFTSAFAFGDSADSLQELMGTLTGTPAGLTTPHSNGLIGIIDTRLTAGLSTQIAITSLMQGIIQDLTVQGGRVLEQQSLMLGDLYPASVIVVEITARSAKGFVAVFETPNGIAEVSLGSVPQRNFDSNRDQLETILNSIRIPAEEAVPVQSPPVEVPASELLTVRAAQDILSLDLPDGWVTLDHAAAENAFAFGDSDQAAQTRLASANPDLAEGGTISGLGGLILLYDAAALNVDPTQPDLNPLMDRVLSSLQDQGYRILESAQPITLGTGSGLLVQIAGTEQGYLALVAFGDTVAYITATGTPNNFARNEALLHGILDSIRVPAADTDSGLGGLGGLGADATPTPAGLGGL